MDQDCQIYRTQQNIPKKKKVPVPSTCLPTKIIERLTASALFATKYSTMLLPGAWSSTSHGSAQVHHYCNGTISTQSDVIRSLCRGDCFFFQNFSMVLVSYTHPLLKVHLMPFVWRSHRHRAAIEFPLMKSVFSLNQFDEFIRFVQIHPKT